MSGGAGCKQYVSGKKMAKKSPFSDTYRDLPCTTVLKKGSQ